MEMIYNSSNYAVVEFARIDGDVHGGGFEIVDKQARREMYLAGASADHFRQNVRELIASSPSIEDIDEFLSQFDGFMNRAVTLQ
jgi:hypothetical protein